MWQFEKWLRAAPRAGDMVREQVPAEGRANQGGKERIETSDIFQHRVRGDEKVKSHLVLGRWRGE